MNHWTPQDREEYEAAVDEAWAASERQSERTDAFLRILLDAQQAGRSWATDVLNNAQRSGMGSLLKAWHKAHNLVPVSFNGQVISQRRIVGTTRTSGTGDTYVSQTLFDFMTVDQLRAKRNEYVSQLNAYGRNIKVVDRLIALCEAANESTPALAAAALGTTVDRWLGDDEGATKSA